MRSLPQILLTTVCTYLFGLYILTAISIEIANKKTVSLPTKKEYCGDKYLIDKGNEVICSNEYNNLVTNVNENMSIICGGFVLTKKGAYNIKNNDTFSFIYLTNSETYFINSIKNIISENKIEGDFNMYISNGFTISVIDNSVFYYECTDHCKNRYFCEKNIYYYI